MLGASVQIAYAVASRDTLLALLQFVIGEIKKPTESVQEFINSKEHRRKLLKYVWLIAVFLTLLASGISLILSYWIAKSLKPGIVLIVFVWAVLLGCTALVSLSSKVLTALFGALVGVSLSEVSTGFSGLLEKATQGIALVSAHISRIAGPTSSGYSDFIGWMVWMFVVVVALFCLPAFFAD